MAQTQTHTLALQRASAAVLWEVTAARQSAETAAAERSERRAAGAPNTASETAHRESAAALTALEQSAERWTEQRQTESTERSERDYAVQRGLALLAYTAPAVQRGAEHAASTFPTLDTAALAETATERMALWLGNTQRATAQRVLYSLDTQRAYTLARRIARRAAVSLRSGNGSAPTLADTAALAERALSVRYTAEQSAHTLTAPEHARESAAVCVPECERCAAISALTERQSTEQRARTQHTLTDTQRAEWERQQSSERAESSVYGTYLDNRGRAPAQHGIPHTYAAPADTPERSALSLAVLPYWERVERAAAALTQRDAAALTAAADTHTRSTTRGTLRVEWGAVCESVGASDTAAARKRAQRIVRAVVLAAAADTATAPAQRASAALRQQSTQRASEQRYAEHAAAEQHAAREYWRRVGAFPTPAPAAAPASTQSRASEQRQRAERDSAASVYLLEAEQSASERAQRVLWTAERAQRPTASAAVCRCVECTERQHRAEQHTHSTPERPTAAEHTAPAESAERSEWALWRRERRQTAQRQQRAAAPHTAAPESSEYAALRAVWTERPTASTPAAQRVFAEWRSERRAQRRVDSEQ